MVWQGLSQRGVCETGKNGGVPHQRYVKAFWPNSGPQPWCAFFVSWCFLQATRRKPPWDNPGWVASVNSWASSHQARVDVPRQGDLFGVGGDHMGMIRGVNTAQRTIVTLEGNTPSGCVRSNIRPFGGLWFARPR